LLRRLPVIAAVLALSLATSCMLNREPDENAEPTPATVLRVENQAFLDMTIYVYRNSTRIRLGQARGNTVTKLTIPTSLMFGSTPLRFQADPIGGTRAPISQEILVSPGDEVTLTIPPS
jgi:hypothetical protein